MKEKFQKQTNISRNWRVFPNNNSWNNQAIVEQLQRQYTYEEAIEVAKAFSKRYDDTFIIAKVSHYISIEFKITNE